MPPTEPIRIESTDCLLIVDLQNDFCPGGALAVADGDAIVPALNRLIPNFSLVITTQDWHPLEHCSFQTNGGPWPVHCVRDTPGAQLHSQLAADSVAIRVFKGSDPDREAYSGFEGDPDLAAALRIRGVDRIFVGGLATDYCVRATVLDALRADFHVVVLTDACRGVNLDPEDSARALREMEEAGAVIASSTSLSLS